MERLGAILALIASAGLARAADWPQFRGVNASGVSTATGFPTEFGPAKNVVWKTALPPGHSSPVLSADRIFVTAYDADQLYVITLDRSTGKILWRRALKRERKQELHKSNSPASPSVATDGTNAYAFFTDFGLVSYGSDGQERWRVPLGPFNSTTRSAWVHPRSSPMEASFKFAIRKPDRSSSPSIRQPAGRYGGSRAPT
jgi:outer membrane protein assembly factor BamB